jgi:hypothetical protein
LVAGAYLHISYDLPRAIADDWPGQGDWSHGPDELRGQQIYSEVRDVFPKSLRRVSRDAKIIGWMVVVLSPLSQSMLAPLGTWMLHLRRAAWDHARVLATQPDRARREAAMAEAMGAALEDVSDFRPWTGSLLEPPDQVLYASIWSILTALLLTLQDYLPLLGLQLVFAFLVSEFYFRSLIRSTDSVSFAEQLAQRLLEYLDVAVHNPDGLANYLAEVRSAAGFARRDDDSLA